ncbi:ribosome biogenesis ATPase [Nematocida sp. AWRm77]|nr:ribosome biogenesis ATPase [Nematocida sp. AWRm77]
MVDYNKRLREAYLQHKEAGEREKALEQNKADIKHLGGLDEQIKEILEYIKLPLEHHKYYEYVGVSPSRGIMVHGPCGSGKTSFVHSIANACRVPVVPLTRADFILKSGEDNAAAQINKAVSMAPAIIFVDEMDTFCRNREELDSESDKRIVNRMMEVIDTLPNKLVLICAATTADAVDPALRRSGRVDREIKLCVPTEEKRVEIIRKVLKDIKHADMDYRELAKCTPGYVGADIKSLVAEAGHCAVVRHLEVRAAKENAPSESVHCDSLDLLHTLHITQEDMMHALKKVQPSAKKEGFIVVPETTFEDIGALHKIKHVLDMTIIQPTLHPERFAAVGIKRPAGVLLYGPPGTGKTMLARAIAGKSHCNFISVKGPELINMYYGESERSLRKLFSRARASQPCVIFFDEIDSICGQRGGNSSRYSDTLVNQLLVEMDGLEERGAVYLIGATNRLDIIDRALLRPGRFDKVIEILPPGKTELVEILEKKLSKISVDCGVDLNALLLDGLTGAEIDLLVREAGSISLEENATEHPRITQVHLEEALNLVLQKKVRLN